MHNYIILFTYVPLYTTGFCRLFRFFPENEQASGTSHPGMLQGASPRLSSPFGRTTGFPGVGFSSPHPVDPVNPVNRKEKLVTLNRVKALWS
jgi:hypothetical protein